MKIWTVIPALFLLMTCGYTYGGNAMWRVTFILRKKGKIYWTSNMWLIQGPRQTAPNVPQWHTDYSGLKSLETQQMQEGLILWSPSPPRLEMRIPISMWRVPFLHLVVKRHPYPQGQGIQIQRSLYKQTLWILFTNSPPQPKCYLEFLTSWSSQT